ncbi:MAG: phage tail tape measure protein [Proteiniphilum sp.]|nr:phage tail tape measure protein [Proteiniphilum sp.]
MGIDPTEIADYTETILKMSSAWGMSADAASESIGKIGSVVKPAEMTWTEFGNRMGSTINDLADSMATSEESIVTGMKKVSAQMAMLKPSPDQLSEWAALIGQLQAFGMTAETSGESLKDALNYMMRDDKSGISSMLDMDATEFQEAIREDAIGTIQELAVAISELPIEEQGQALQKFGATGGQMMGMLVGKVDPVTKEVEGLNAALETGASAWENASSLNEAYAKSQETLNAQIDIFRGKISVAATSIGTVLLPYLTQMMEAVNDITQALIDLGTRGWQWLTGGAEGENVTERAAGKVRSWADSQGWLSGYLADYDAAKARDAGVDLGQDLTKGVAEGTEGVGPAIEGNLENVDGEGAGESVGKDFQTGFLAGTAKLGGMFTKQSMDSMHAAGMMYNYATGQYESRSGGGSDWQWGETFEAGGSTIGFGYEKGGQIPWVLQIGDWRKSFDSPYAARAYVAEHFLALDDLISPEQWEIAWKSARQKTTGSYDDPGDVVRLKAKLELDAEAEISPYDIWGTPQHWADYSAKYWGEIEDLTILELYNLEDHLRSEGAAGWERAWETILDPDATEAQITGALGVLSPVLEEMGYENGDSYLLGLRERVAESGAELADSIVDSGKYQEYKIEELGETWGNALKDSMINVQEQETLLGIVDALEDAGYEGSAALRQAILDEDWEGLGALIGGLTGDGFTTALNVLGGPALLDGIFRRTAGGDLKEYSLADLLDMSKEERDLIIADYDAWGKNVLIPTISDLVGEMNTDWGEGYTENRKIVEVALWDIIDAYHEFGTAFSKEQAKLVEDLEAGTIGAEKFLDSWLNLGKSANLLNGAMKTAEAACSECQEAMSEFGIWQEENADRLFSRSFIGPTDDYQKFLEQERARGAIHPEPIQLSMVYKADTTEADAALEELKESASETQYMPIEIDDVEAYSAIESINAAASAPVIKPVYIQEYGGGSGSSMPTASASTVSWLNSICPSCTSSPGWGTSDWLPALAEGGIVSRPIIAQVGEVPEAIAPLNVLFPAIQQAVAAAGGGGGVTINSTVIVQGGTVLDEDELQQVLNSRDDQLKNEIARKYLGR